MDISLTKPSALSSSQLDRWREVVRDNPQYDSPFYAPEFTLAVAASRDDVELAVEKQGNKLGLLPFQRESRRTGRPVGWKLNDFQGAILPPFMSINPVELLRACGLSIWRFDHLHGAQMWCESAQTVICQSPVINLQEGYKAYLESKRASGDSRLKTVMRKTRKIAREVGDIRLEFDCRDSHVLTSLLRWKSEQLNQSGN